MVSAAKKLPTRPVPKALPISLDALREEFLSNVSHEFRSPFSAVKGYLDLMLMQKESLSAKHLEYALDMREGLNRLGRFIDDLMDLTVLRGGLIQLFPEPLDVRDIFAKSIQRHQRQLSSCHLKARLDCPEGLCVWADPERLRQTIAHLMSNALKYTPEGGTVTLWAKKGTGSDIVLGITDTGIGIPKEKWAAVFKKFEQILEDKHKVRKTTGTGMGLALVKGWVEAQGGRVWIESSSGQGTTMAWTLPKPGQAS